MFNTKNNRTMKIYKSDISRFKSEQNALNFSNRSIKPQMILLGDNETYFVCNLRVSSILQKQGYELAPNQY